MTASMTEDRCFEELRTGGLEGTRAESWDPKRNVPSQSSGLRFPLECLTANYCYLLWVGTARRAVRSPSELQISVGSTAGSESPPYLNKKRQHVVLSLPI